MSATRTVVEALLTLLVVAVAVFAALALARRAGVGRGFGAAELVGHLPLEARRAIYLVKVGGRVLVVGASEAGLAKLGEVDGDLVATPTPRPKTFGDALAQILAARGPKAKDGERDREHQVEP
ncbi:MAG: flagellar biosynthetic protein FliO [Myxococcales bacterium]|nr:flagellar biosynthetic protein FliO [Myxococcales bacterium]